MSVRIQVVVDPGERDVFYSQAVSEGKSLSEWMKIAARERLANARDTRLATVDDLDAFFEKCDQREQGVEPDWAEHLDVIDQSRSSGVPRT